MHSTGTLGNSRTRHLLTLTMLFTIAAFSIAPHHRTLQAYLAAVEPGTYMHCLYNGDELINSTTFPEMEYPLGNPTGPATEKVKGSGKWARSFASGTSVVWDDNTKKGSVSWGHLQ